MSLTDLALVLPVGTASAWASRQTPHQIDTMNDLMNGTGRYPGSTPARRPQPDAVEHLLEQRHVVPCFDLAVAETYRKPPPCRCVTIAASSNNPLRNDLSLRYPLDFLRRTTLVPWLVCATARLMDHLGSLPFRCRG
jgi:hypothetical protein